jgi:hypothetical protein
MIAEFLFQPASLNLMYRSILSRGRVASLLVATFEIAHCPFPSFPAPERKLQAPVLGRLATLDCTPRTNLCHSLVRLHEKNRLSKIPAPGSIAPHNRIMRELPT